MGTVKYEVSVSPAVGVEAKKLIDGKWKKVSWPEIQKQLFDDIVKNETNFSSDNRIVKIVDNSVKGYEAALSEIYTFSLKNVLDGEASEIEFSVQKPDKLSKWISEKQRNELDQVHSFLSAAIEELNSKNKEKAKKTEEEIVKMTYVNKKKLFSKWFAAAAGIALATIAAGTTIASIAWYASNLSKDEVKPGSPSPYATNKTTPINPDKPVNTSANQIPVNENNVVDFGNYGKTDPTANAGDYNSGPKM